MPIDASNEAGLLPHLSGPGAVARQALAAHFLRECRHIVEIGGAGRPITDFITHAPDSVTVIDPRMEPYASDRLAGRPCRVRHEARKWQAAPIGAGEGSLGLVLLGLSLKAYGENEMIGRELIALARRADVTIIEYAISFERSLTQAPALVAAAGLRPDVVIDLTIGDGVIEASGYAARRMLVLRPAG